MVKRVPVRLTGKITTKTGVGSQNSLVLVSEKFKVGLYNQSINETNYFIVCLKVDQRAGQLKSAALWNN